MVKVYAPASSANMSVGFDVLGAAVTPVDGSLLGDTVTDVKTAASAQVRVALVSFGPEGPGIARLRPDAMLDHFDALPALARGWLG